MSSPTTPPGPERLWRDAKSGIIRTFDATSLGLDTEFVEYVREDKSDRSLAVEIAEAQQRIKPWIHHHHDCALLEADPNGCTCGIGDALNDFWEVEARARDAGLLGTDDA